MFSRHGPAYASRGHVIANVTFEAALGGLGIGTVPEDGREDLEICQRAVMPCRLPSVRGHCDRSFTSRRVRNYRVSGASPHFSRVRTPGEVIRPICRRL